MKIVPSTKDMKPKIPLKLVLSFEGLFEYLEEVASNEQHLLHQTAINLLEEMAQYPELKAGFEDLSLLYKYEKQIDKLLDLLFPDPLQSNEIKAASIPFEFTMFKFTKRFENILIDSGRDFTFELRNFDESKMYILACTFILAQCHGEYIDFKRPFYFDIPDEKSGLMRHYRALFNGDFFKVKPLESAPELTPEDIAELRDNFDNVELWQEKFPPGSYEFRGFGIINLFDVTPDQNLSKVNEQLLQRDGTSFKELEHSIGNMFSSKEVQFGFSLYSIDQDQIDSKFFNKQNSFLHSSGIDISDKTFFCGGVAQQLFEKKELVAISDMDKYGKATDYNAFSRVLLNQGIKSVILVPIPLPDNLIGLMELVSPNTYELNSINAYKLKDIIPVFKLATQRFLEEFQNKMESIIQEHYTSIHPTVKWKFHQEAEAYYFSQMMEGEKVKELSDVVFEQVVPLYGQSDIRNSSVIRNKSIQSDLSVQLQEAGEIITEAYNLFSLPIYADLSDRIAENLELVESGLKSGDEKGLTDFLQNEIYPVFDHVKTMDKTLAERIASYMGKIDSDLNVLYDKRRAYDDSVNALNQKLADFIDMKQEEAQAMFPHYFERYKTDGIEYNMYIGASLVRNKTYHDLYLQNLRLWQLQMMCEMENVAYGLKETLDHPLEVASLILAHSSPLSIKFRMDEKRFDVDGAYNIRYEIIKKRIDKAKIEGTTERLTQPGKIAIVYTQRKDAQEYLKYIKHLQTKKFLLDEVEDLKIEDLQGISGLKALRVSVNYEHASKDTVTFQELMKVISS